MPHLPYIEDGKPMLDLALVANFYFRDAHLPEVRRRVMICFRNYAAVAGNVLHHCSFPIGDARGRWKRYKPDSLGVLEMKLIADGGSEYDFVITGGQNYEEATQFQINTTGVSEWEQQRWPTQSFLQFYLPWTWYSAASGNFPAFFNEMASILKPRHGFGGLGFATSRDISNQRQMEKLIYLLARSTPALVVENHYFDAGDLVNGIREGTFLTALDSEWAAKLGGPSAIEHALGKDFKVRRYDGGMTIQAGTEPNPIGPSIYQTAPPDPPLVEPASNDWPEPAVKNAAQLYPLYHRLNQVLKPIRVKPEDFKGSFQVGEFEKVHFFDRERSIQWMARFD